MKIKIECKKIYGTQLTQDSREKFIALNIYIRKERSVKSIIKALTLRTKKIKSKINSKQVEKQVE